MSHPIWSPSAERIRNANMAAFLTAVREQIAPAVTDYPSLYRWSVDQPQQFWPSRFKWEVV